MTNRCSSENQIWPFAGTPMNPALPRRGDKAPGVDNQQERPRAIEESSETRRRTSECLDEEMVPTAWRHAAMTSGREVCRLSALLRKVSSEIPCRVSSDPHERRNDLAAVSRRDPAKLRYP